MYDLIKMVPAICTIIPDEYQINDFKVIVIKDLQIQFTPHITCLM